MITVNEIEKMERTMANAKTEIAKADGAIETQTNRLLSEFGIREDKVPNTIQIIDTQIAAIDAELETLIPTLKKVFGQ
jgi:hypothetical protein